MKYRIVLTVEGNSFETATMAAALINRGIARVARELKFPIMVDVATDVYEKFIASEEEIQGQTSEETVAAIPRLIVIEDVSLTEG